MIAVVLAGGKGSRLKEKTKALPKPMVEVAGKPLLEHSLSWLKREGVEEAWITLNYLPEVVQQHFGEGGGKYPRLHYYVEPQARGSAGALYDIRSSLKETVLVVYGDVYMEVDLKRLHSFHKVKQAEATLVLHPNDHPHDSDLVETDAKDRILNFHAKPRAHGQWLPNLVNAGLYLIEPELCRHIPNEGTPDFGRDLFPDWVNRFKMYGYNTPEYMKDMGTPDRLEKVEKDVLAGLPVKKRLSERKVAVFLDRDGVVNDDTEFISTPEQMQVYPFASEAIKQLNKSGMLAILATNQSVVARNLTTMQGLQKIHHRMETDLGRDGAYLDAIYFCPHHPDKGFPEENPEFKTECNCRKPKPGMLLEAAGRFNIDLQASFMVGDNERDLQAGAAAGCTTIGVETGKGLKDGQTQPDLFFPNLLDAVRFLTSNPWEKALQDIDSALAKRPSNSLGLVRIGGNTGSGKTTLCTWLARHLRLQGKKVLVVRLDDWIVPRKKRKPGEDNFEHTFRLHRLAGDLNDILQGKPVMVPGYARHPGQKAKALEYQRHNEEIVLVEGVPALHDSFDVLPWTCSIGLKESKETLEKRVHALYTWKGYLEEERQALWKKREAKEYREIATLVQKADFVYTRP